VILIRWITATITVEDELWLIPRWFGVLTVLAILGFIAFASLPYFVLCLAVPCIGYSYYKDALRKRRHRFWMD
jgi:hypothetical protein